MRARKVLALGVLAAGVASVQPAWPVAMPPAGAGAAAPGSDGSRAPLVLAVRAPDGSLSIRRPAAKRSATAADAAEATRGLRPGEVVVAASADRRVVLDDGDPEPPPPFTAASPSLGRPDDPYRPRQWALDVTTFEAARSQGDGAGVVVAVVDTGVDADHEDLRGRVLTGHRVLTDDAGNTVEGPGAADDHRHGTHVAGIVAAATGNGAGVAAAAPGVQILPVKVLAADGSGRLGDIAAGVVWAVDHGATVLNLSLGIASTAPDPVLAAALAYARQRDVVVVAAAGNSGCEVDGTTCLPLYPAADPSVLAVGALGSPGPAPAAVDPGVCSPFSTRAGYVDLAAPGSGILSTLLTARTPPGYAPYATASGTSVAAPQVAAAAAVLRSAHPELGAGAVAALLRATAVDVLEPGPDRCSGSGLVDPRGALAAAAAGIGENMPSGTVVPAAPRLIGAVAGRGMVRLSFVAPPGASAVRIYRDGLPAATVAGSARSFTDRFGGRGVRMYAVSAVSGGVEGPPSAVRSARAR